MWVIAEFPKVCFPVLAEIVEIDNDIELQNIDGTAKFKYKVTKDEAARMINDFELLVEDVMNEAMDPEYTDLENMLSLYMFFEDTYTYDHETAELIDSEPSKNLVDMPTSALTHIQKTTPGPPIVKAIATPAILPMPTVAAIALNNACTELIWPDCLPWSLACLSRNTRNARGKRRMDTAPEYRNKNKPPPMRRKK
jgi:hypothetical protein